MRTIRARVSLVAFTLMLLALAGRGVAAEYPIPHLTGNAEDWNDYLLVDNTGTESASFELRLYADSKLVSITDLAVGGLQSLTLNIESYGENAQCGLITAADGGTLRFRLAFENTIGGGVAEFALEDNRAAFQTLLFSDYAEAVDWKGMGIANLTTQTAEVKLFGLNEDNVFLSRTIFIPPLSNISGVDASFFPGNIVDGLQKLVAVSSQPLSSLVISGSHELDTLLFTLGGTDTEFDYLQF